MSKLTERLIQVAAVTLVLWFGYQLIERTVIDRVRLAQRVNVLAAQLQQVRAAQNK